MKCKGGLALAWTTDERKWSLIERRQTGSAKRYGDTWYLTGKRSARFKCFEASTISIPMIRSSAPMSNTISSVERLLMTSCLRSSSRMYTRSALALYRISIINLPFAVKDVDGNGNYNIPFSNEKDFHSFVLVVSPKAVLLEFISLRFSQTAVFRRYRNPGVNDID